MSIRHILIWAILIRFLIMPLFLHPDLKDIHLRVSYLHTEKVFNIYEHLKQDAFTKIHAPDFAYPPLTYFTLGSYQFLINPLLGADFPKWINDYSDYRHSTPFIFRYLFSLKIIYFIFELLTGLIIYKLISDPVQKKTALLFWFFNPLNLYAIYAIGQFDIIPTFFSLLSLYFWNNKHSFLGGLSLGLGIAYKSFPLLFLPLFLITKSTIKEKIIFSVSSVSVYALTILPFINSSQFQQDVLFSGLSTRIFDLKLHLGFIDLSVFILLYGLFLLLVLLRKKTLLCINILIALLLVFSLTRFHPQWIIWLMPFLTLAFAQKALSLKLIFPFFFIYFLYFILFGDSFLITGLFAPVSTLYLEIPPFTQLITENHIPLLQSITQFLFAISALLIVIKLIIPIVNDTKNNMVK